MPRPGKGAITERMRAPRPEPRVVAPVKIKDGDPPPHFCSAKLPAKELTNAIYRCTCGEYYRFMGLWYDYESNKDMQGSWARCTKEGRMYRWTYLDHKKKTGFLRWEKVYGWRLEDND